MVRHVPCQNITEFEAAVTGINLEGFSVALIPDELAKQVAPDHPIWTIFVDAEVAPVLVTASEEVDIEEIALRAAFASVLPAAPNFAELRSAIRIGCSFSRQFRMPHEDDRSALSLYKPRRVLVADDNRTNRNVLAAILESAGHDVILVTDGDEALEALEKGGIDILLLDINMPRLNGIDACSMWRQIEGGRQHIPIIGVTADATSETEVKCRNAGMDLRITKPVDAKLLLASIEHHCEAGISNGNTNVVFDDPMDVVVPINATLKVQNDAIDAVQLDYLKSIGDQAFVESMVEGFFEDISQTLVPLRLAVKDGNVAEFRFCAHALKSSGNNMGAKRLAELCGRLERVTEADFIQHGDAYLQKIETEIVLAVDALEDNASLATKAPAMALSR